MRHRAGVFATIVAVTAALVGTAGPAAAVVPGFDVRITELPDAFAAGAGPDTVTAVASTVAGRRCQKVRWSMLMRVEGVRLDQVKVDRVEDTGSFPLRVQADGDTARLTDAQLDPGSLCPGRTVTARYRVAFDDAAAQGRVTFQAEAYDTNERLLQLASATTQVVGGEDDADEDRGPQETRPAPSPTASAEDDADADESPVDDAVTPEPTDEVDEPVGDEVDPTAPADDSIAAVPTSAGGGSGLLGAGLIIGAVLIFVGVGLLLRLRMRGRRPDAQPATARFHPAR